MRERLFLTTNFGNDETPVKKCNYHRRSPYGRCKKPVAR